MKSTQSSTGNAGRSIADFCDETAISRASFYLLPQEQRPRLTRLGRKVIITESPEAWLARISKDGGVRLVKRYASQQDAAAV